MRCNVEITLSIVSVTPISSHSSHSYVVQTFFLTFDDLFALQTSFTYWSISW